ncbi:PREDICTED: uncharacterized protein LOC104766258 [Camelina sativa]|uniref:Uncharacterized protein LOC104766258 n=1 Tax=Camelina sativa TaxID=90675 RepID=A0ABM0XN69_CAMSA|nr:PREDICTED: uncharacterized protein LOC104766258 [Camelina sativa]
MNQNQYHYHYHARGVQSSDPRRGAATHSQSQGADAPNWLLAGYMAHEFLTCGTMLGRKLYPGWAEVGPLVSPSPPPQQQRETKKARQSYYSDVAGVFKTDGNHVPGVVNPTQLAKWIQM